MKELGIDVSHWRPKLIPSLIEGHVKWISAKAVEVDDQIYNGWNANSSVDMFVDDTFAGHCQTAYDIGAKFIPFIFVNTRYKSEWYASAYADHTKHPNDRDAEILALRQALKNKEYHAFSIDCERWWKFYGPYLQMIAGKLPGDQVEKISSLWIRNHIADTYTRIQEEMGKGNFRTVPINFYFGKWFVDGYSPELDTFLADKLQWITKYNGAVWLASLKTDADHLGKWEDLEALIAATTFTAPWVGNRPADMYQLTDRYVLPGVQDLDGKPLGVDIDITMTDWSKLFAGEVVVPPPVVVVPPVVVPPDLTALTARVEALELWQKIVRAA